MKQTTSIAVLCIAALFCSNAQAQNANPTQSRESGMASELVAKSCEPTLRLKLTADENVVYVKSESPVAGPASLVRCRANEYNPAEAFLERFDGIGDDCKDDGYDVDRAYYKIDRSVPIVEASDFIQEASFPRFTPDGRDKIYDRFYVCTADDELVPLSLSAFVSEFPSANDEPREEPASIKGLEAFDLEDAKELGVNCAAMTVDLCWLVQTEGVETLEFPCDGKTYRFNKQAVAYYDSWAKKATDYGMESTFVLVFWGHRRHLAPQGWIFPDFEVWSTQQYALSIAAPDTTTSEGLDRLQALYEFLGSRYTRKDKAFGRVSNFVIGNELNSGYIWNNMGRLPLDETIRQYERQLRIAYAAFKKYWSGAKVLTSFDNFWTKNSAVEFMQEQYVNKGGFSGKEYLLELARLTRKEGDYPWGIAYHPYGLDLRTPVFWDQYSTEQAAKNLDAPRITPYNCEVLSEFLDLPEMRAASRDKNDEEALAKREIFFTEQGFASPHNDNYGEYQDSDYDPNAIPQEWLDRQAAAFAMGYYAAVACGAKAYIVHRQHDVRSEGLNIGLWARPKGKETGPGVKKPVWFLFQEIDKVGSDELTKKYLPILRFYPRETAPESWEELVPNFDVVRQSLR